MSKIQKALNTLREASLETVETSLPENERASRRSENGRAEKGTLGNRRSSRYLIDPSKVERPVSFVSHVDVSNLVKEGLLPIDAHAELVAQEYRRIKRPILGLAFGMDVPKGRNSNVIMVASALPKTGKTFSSVNLARSIARERDIGAVLVDADVLKPNISRTLGFDERIGLIDYLLDSSIAFEDILVGTDFHEVVVVPAGQRHEEATELLASRRMETFIDMIAERFSNRAVIVDTPPLLLTSETNVLAKHMGQVVFVIEAGRSTQDSVIEALNSLDRDLPINAVLNKSRGITFGDYGGGYGYGYGPYSAPYGG